MVLFYRSAAINRQIKNKNKILATILTGIVCIIAPVLIIILDPVYIIAKHKLRLAKDTILYNLLKHEIPGVRLSIYLFNITNADRFLSGEDPKLKVDEVGPFVFQEYRWYEDMEVSKDGKEMDMTAKIRTEFVPEASLAHPKDINLTLPNLPMLSSTALISSYPSVFRHTFNLMADQLRSKAIINVDVHNYLWGYDNNLVSLINSLAPGLVYFDKVGLLDRLYDYDSVYRITVGATDLDRFKIKLVKKTTHLHTGTNNNVAESEMTFTDTYEGIGYPPMLTPDIPINLFRLGLCKVLRLEYMGTKTMKYGGEGFIYTISNQTFMSGVDPITSKPYPDGLMDISGCFYGIPFVVSKAHFLDADPKLLERIEGLYPDKNVHVNEIIIDRKIGVTFNTKMALQLSIAIDDVQFNSEASRLSNLVLPIVHLKLDQPKMPEDIMYKFWLVYKIGPFLVLCLEILLFLTSLALLAHALRSIHLNWESTVYTNGMMFETTIDKNFIIKAELPLIK